METSFDAHPDETMVTMFHLDGDRLLLTHHCVAKNQPRLVATSIDETAAEVIFEFLDATGIESRDRGHMDKVVWHFDGPDRREPRATFARGSPSPHPRTQSIWTGTGRHTVVHTGECPLANSIRSASSSSVQSAWMFIRIRISL